MIESLMWGVALISLVGTYANIQKQRYCFILWSFSNLAWVAYDVQKAAYPQAALMAVYFGLAVWGWRKWKEVPDAKE